MNVLTNRKGNVNAKVTVFISIIVICFISAISVSFYVSNKNKVEKQNKIKQEIELTKKKKIIKENKLFKSSVKNYYDYSNQSYERIKKYIYMEKSVWYNCINEEKNNDTDKFTMNKKGEFYNDFNDALGSWFNSMDCTELSNNYQSAESKESSKYDEVIKFKRKSKKDKDIIESIKKIHEQLIKLVNYNDSDDYTYEEYNSKTKEYYSKITDLMSELQIQIESY